jgi:hypothetical protein
MGTLVAAAGDLIVAGVITYAILFAIYMVT